MPISITGSGLINGLELPTDSIQPGLVHIATETFSAVSSLTLNEVFTSDYTNYQVIMSFSATSTPTTFNIRFATGGSANTGTYLSQRLDVNSSTVSGTATNTNSGNWGSGNNSIATVTNLIHGVFSGPATTNPTTWTGQCARSQTATQAQLTLNSGIHNVASAFDGLVVFPGSGTITGTIRVYGYRNGI
jgi:hypothetical protein